MMPCFKSNSSDHWPQDVGIVDMEIYFPSIYVDQAQLEELDGVGTGKYTIGFGQDRMSFCDDREDTHSLCLTVVQRLMDRTGIGYESIGRLEVGTESLLDKSKSVKSVLMQLFEESGNTNVEGVDTTNACYGGTASLFNAVAWVESSAWDGRYALTVAGDIAEYPPGNARCTGGAGAVAMLIGPNAALVLERGLRYTHMAHSYDFYKPDLSIQYPYFDGKLSVKCYLESLDKCYQGFKRKAQMQLENGGGFGLEQLDGILFHSPYCKLVQKSLARLALNDFLMNPHPDIQGKYAGLDAFRCLKLEDTYFNRDIEKAFLDFSREMFEQKTKPSLLVAKQVGNMYTPSLYSCLISYIISLPLSQLPGKKISMFSYGSGLASSMYLLRISSDCSIGSPLEKLKSSLSNIPVLLESRKLVSPTEFEAIMKVREEAYLKAPYFPTGDVNTLFPATWFLTEVDERYRRKYEWKPAAAHNTNISSDKVTVASTIINEITS